MSGYGIKATWWPAAEFGPSGSYHPDRRAVDLAGLDAQTLADVLRALARDIERNAGLRPIWTAKP